MAAALTDELQQFRRKTVRLTDDVVELRERPHDDLVLVVAVAAWHAERPSGLFIAVILRDPPIPIRTRWQRPWGW